MARDAAKSQAQIKKERDKAALDKQRCVLEAHNVGLIFADTSSIHRADQVKAKLEKQKKAAKGERRA